MKRRRGLDTSGKPLVEVKTRDGVFVPEVDEDTIAKLRAADLSIVDTQNRRRPDILPFSGAAVGTNPYQGLKVDDNLKKRSKLDYMRALSEEIKKRRHLEEARARGDAADEDETKG